MIEKLKVGDKVYISDDLVVGEIYGSDSYQKQMMCGVVIIESIDLCECSFRVEKDEFFNYTPGMIDWDKTNDLQEGKSMKTSKENQILVLEKAMQNIKDNKWYRDGIQFYSKLEGGYIDCTYDDRPFLFDFVNHSFIVKPQTITINGVEIPKPLSEEERYNYENLYEPCTSNNLYRMVFKVNYSYYNKDSLLYSSSLEAITASKALFGIGE